MMTLSTVGQWWVAKTSEYKIPGGVTTTCYPVEYFEGCQLKYPVIAYGNLSIGLQYYDEPGDSFGINPPNNIYGTLSSIVKYYSDWPVDSLQLHLMNAVSGNLDSIVKYCPGGEDYYQALPPTNIVVALNTIVVTYSLGLPEVYKVYPMTNIEGALYED